MWVEMLRSKDEALAYFRRVKARAKTEFEGKLKAIRTDRGGEFNSTQFSVFFAVSMASSTTPPPLIHPNKMEWWSVETKQWWRWQGV
jgi:hypothetical protein